MSTSVVIAGGGVGALEPVLALQALAGDRVDITLLRPNATSPAGRPRWRSPSAARGCCASTPERAPLEVFGPAASADVAALLAAHRIEVHLERFAGRSPKGAFGSRRVLRAVLLTGDAVVARGEDRRPASRALSRRPPRRQRPRRPPDRPGLAISKPK